MVDKEKAYFEKVTELISIMRDIANDFENDRISTRDALEQMYAEFNLGMPEICEYCGDTIDSKEDEVTLDYKGEAITVHEWCRTDFEDERNI